jgi:hypothetical protein
MVKSGEQRHLILFLVLFLLSRLKKFRPDAYYQQLRTTILCYDLLGNMRIARNQRYIISGAMLMANLQMLEFLKEKDDEAHIIKNYYHTANKLFNEELTFVNTLLAQFQGTTDEEEPVLPWIADGARIMKLVFDFDVEITERMYSDQKVQMERDKIALILRDQNKGCDSEILYLLNNWTRLVPKELAVF